MVDRSTDRILVLERVNPDNKDTGLFDPQVLSGTNKLHAVMDTRTCMWSLKYDRGIIPEALRQKFTSFRTLHEITETYLRLRNIKIVQVID